MAIYVKEKAPEAISAYGTGAGTDHFVLYVDAKTELTGLGTSGATLVTANYATVVCEAGSVAYTYAGEVLILRTTGAWVEVS
jgi:hypothetical protein